MARFRVELELSAEEEDSGTVVEEITETTSGRFQGLDAAVETFGRSKLRSKTPEHALRELDWSLLGLWMIQLFAMKEQLAIGHPPTHSSAARAIHAIRDVFHHWSEIPTKGTSLKSKLRQAVTDQYQRSKESKRARYRPDNKDKPSAGKPILLAATRQHKLLLKNYLALSI